MPATAAERMRPLAEFLDRTLHGTGMEDAAKRMSMVAFGIRVISAALAFLLQVVLARLIGTYEYGIFALVWVAVVIAGNLSCLGFQTAVIRFLPQYADAKDYTPLRGILVSSRIFAIVSATFFAVLGALGILFFSAQFGSTYVVPFLIGVLAMPMVALGDVLDGTARANGWAARALGPTYIVRPILTLAFMTFALLAGFEMSGVTALLSAVLATYVTSIGQLTIVSGMVDRKYPAGPRSVHLKTWLSVSLPIFLVEGFFFLMVNADVLMVGLLMTPEDVAIYYATVKTMALVHFAYFAVKAGVAHQFSANMDNPDKSGLHALALRSVTWTFWPSLAMAIVLLIAGPLLLSMFGAGFRDGYPLLFILVSGVVLRASIGPAESLLNMSGHQNVCAKLFAFVLVVNITLNAMLIPIWGLAGAATATALATVVEAAGLYFLVRKLFGLSMFIFARHAKGDR